MGVKSQVNSFKQTEHKTIRAQWRIMTFQSVIYDAVYKIRYTIV